MLTRISGQGFVLNCDLIERIDSTPDTVVSMVDGRKYVVTESPREVVAKVRLYRSEIVALSHHLPAEDLVPPSYDPSYDASGHHDEQSDLDDASDLGSGVSAVVSLHSAPSVRNS